MKAEDPWRELGLKPGADAGAVRAAYLQAVKAHHPDRFRNDPVRFRLEEERMKRINAAYHRLLEEAAASPPQDVAPSPPGPVCARHGARAVTTCRVCGTPLCRSCAGAGERLCDLHRRRRRAPGAPGRPGGRGTALGLWIPLIAGVAMSRMLGLPALAILLAAGIYVAVLGARRLWRWRWLGIALMVFFPYSMLLAGAYTLFTALGPPRRRAWS